MIYVKFITIVFIISKKNGRHYFHTNFLIIIIIIIYKQKQIANADSEKILMRQ